MGSRQINASGRSASVTCETCYIALFAIKVESPKTRELAAVTCEDILIFYDTIMRSFLGGE